MRGVKYVTYAFVAIICMTIGMSVWFGRYSHGSAKRHTDTFIRILSSCSILLTFVFYYNLIKSHDEQRIRAEQQDTDHELDRRSNSRKEFTQLYVTIPNSIMSIVELKPHVKKCFAVKAKEANELHKGLTEYRLKSVVFDMWVSDIDLFYHRGPSMVSRVALMITQALSPILRSAWKEYAFQYSRTMNEFVNTMYEVIDTNVNMTDDYIPKYVTLALIVLEKTGHLDVKWDANPPYYKFREKKYLNDLVEHEF